MKILKFGGSSLARPDCICRVVEIVAAARREDEIAVVVSALGGVTDALVRAAQVAASGRDSYLDSCRELEVRHAAAIRALVAEEESGELEAALGSSMAELRDLLQGVALVREASPRTSDRILSYGERLSMAIVAAALREAGIDAEGCDARRLIVTDREFGQARVDLEVTYRRIRNHFQSCRRLQVVTGFIGATPEGDTTTLGRGGSDYTASLIGAALGADAVELWTDVDGVLSADPRIVSDASPIEALCYEELMELSHFGAKVVHPPSVHPTRSCSIPLLIRNTFNPDFPGTRVTGEASASRGERPVAGVSSIHRIALLRLEGDGMVGVPGIAERLFGALARRGVNVILISQASSEHSICLAVAPDDVVEAQESVEREFALERRAGLVDPLVVQPDQSVVAVVGAGMRERPGIAGRVFGVLGGNGINVRAIAQGSSELNISLVVGGEDQARALNVIHEAFFSPQRLTVGVVLAGVGRVGGAFLAQLASQQEKLEKERGLRLQLAGLAGSNGLLTSSDGIACEGAIQRLRSEASAAPADAVATFATELATPLRVFIDCTASDEVASLYDRLLAAGVCVVTANKRRLAGPLDDYRRLVAVGRDRLFFETTVGAGLPVLRTLDDLCATGDQVLRIEGLLSGTLGFLMDRLARGCKFSRALRQAYDLGYTEPDPREDLSGHDVARKLMILGRQAGFDLEADDVTVEPLLPQEPWARLSLRELWKRLPEVDESFAHRHQAAANDGSCLRYMASLDQDRVEVRLRSIPGDHACATVGHSDNLVAFTTRRYCETPLIVRGPGAGPEVTAAGVFADVLRAAFERRLA